MSAQRIKTQLMQHDIPSSIADTLHDTFQNNMTYLSLELPEIHKGFSNYEPRYFRLAYLNEHIHILDSENRSLYGESSPHAVCQHLVNEFQHSPIALSTSFYKSSGSQYLHAYYVGKLLELYKKQATTSPKIEHLPKTISSLVIFSTGIGYSIELLLKQHNILNLYLVEPNPDLFYLSLFTTDWASILSESKRKGNNIHLNIGSDPDFIFQDIYNQMSINGRFFSLTTFLFPNFLDTKNQHLASIFINKFNNFFSGYGFFDDSLISIAHTIKNTESKIPYFIKQEKKLDLAGHKALIVASGPSVDQQIDTLKELQSSFIIFSCGSALRMLIKNGITPDFHVEMERTLPVVEWLDQAADRQTLKNLTLLALDTVHPEVFALFGKKGRIMKSSEAGTLLMEECIPNDSNMAICGTGNPSVANTALSFAVFMGFDEVYLFGCDMGYQAAGSHHSKYSAYHIIKQEAEATVSQLHADRFPVEPNFPNELITSSAWLNTCRQHLSTLIKLSKKACNIDVFNCSHGAKIDGALPLHSDMIIPPSPLKKKEDIIDQLFQHHFSDKHLDGLSRKLERKVSNQEVKEVLDSIKNFILEHKDHTKSSEEALTTLRDLQKKIAQIPISNSSYIHLLLEGSFNYFTSILNNMIMQFQETEETLDYFKEGLSICCDFLDSAYEKFEREALKPDQQKARYF